jgi:ubiquinone/menaquinone biosynthesis C-methylase UbiE
MLARSLEPEVMDSAEEARDYDAMDHAAVNAVFVVDFLACWDGRNPVLDLGTGPAQIAIELCRRHPGALVTGVDLSEAMLAVARHNVRRAGLEERIRLERQDAKHLHYHDAAFGALVSNSIVHHIPQPAQVFAEMVRVCAPGGRLFVRDLLRPADEATLSHLVQVYAAGADARQRQMFADSLHAALNVEEVRALVSELGYDRGTVVQTTDRHWTWSVPR